MSHTIDDSNKKKLKINNKKTNCWYKVKLWKKQINFLSPLKNFFVSFLKNDFSYKSLHRELVKNFVLNLVFLKCLTK